MVQQSYLAENDTEISYEISSKILTVGLEHKPYKGGIGYLIHIYSQHFKTFKYLTTYKFFSNRLYVSLYFTKQYFKLIKILILDKKIELVHIHGASYGSFYRKFIIFLTAKYLFGLKTIYHMNGSEFKVFYGSSNIITKRLIHLMVENTDVMICLSKSWENYFVNNFKMKRIEILGNVISMPNLKSDNSVKIYDTKLNVLFLGLLGHRKGVFDLLNAISIHKNELEGRLNLTMGGNGEVEKVQQFIKDNHLENIVCFKGWIEGELKQRLLNEHDVYILPSYNEGLPLAILEAMSYGLPIISTPVGGIPEVVQDGVNGFLVPPGDIDAIYSSLLKFLNNPLLISSMGDESLSIVEPYYPKSVIPKLRYIYKSLLTDLN